MDLQVNKACKSGSNAAQQDVVRIMRGYVLGLARPYWEDSAPLV